MGERGAPLVNVCQCINECVMKIINAAVWWEENSECTHSTQSTHSTYCSTETTLVHLTADILTGNAGGKNKIDGGHRTVHAGVLGHLNRDFVKVLSNVRDFSEKDCWSTLFVIYLFMSLCCWFSVSVTFVWADLNTAIVLCGKTTAQRPFKGSGLGPIYKFELSGSCSQIACWDADERNQQLPAASRSKNESLIWTIFLIFGEIGASSGLSSCVRSMTHKRRERSHPAFSDAFWFPWMFFCVKRNQTNRKRNQVYQLNHWFRRPEAALTSNLFGSVHTPSARLPV